jgi:hypothetical protein
MFVRFVRDVLAEDDYNGQEPQDLQILRMADLVSIDDRISDQQC